MASSGEHHLQLADGEYTLSQPISGSIIIEAQSMEGAVAQPFSAFPPCTFSALMPLLPITHRVKLSGIGTQGISINTKNPGDFVFVRGIDLLAKEKTAVTITSGKVQFQQANIIGRVQVIGQTSDVFIDDTIIRPPLMPVELGDLRARDSTNDIYVTKKDCAEAGVSVTNGATYGGFNVEIADAPALGICVSSAAAILCNGSIHDTRKSSDGKYGRGGEVLRGGSLTFRGTHIYDNSEVGLVASDSGSKLSLSNGVEIETHKSGAVLATAVGLMAQAGATLEATDVNVHDNSGLGVMITSGAYGTISRTRIAKNEGAGVVVYNANLTISSSQIQDTGNDASLGLGMGLLAFNAPSVTATDTTFARNVYSGAFISGEGGSVLFSGCTFSDNKKFALRSDLGYLGAGLFASGRCSGLSLQANTYSNNEGPHVFLDRSYASLSNSSYSKYSDASDTAFLAQNCTCQSGYMLSNFETLGLPKADYSVLLCPSSHELIPTLSFGFALQEPLAMSE